MEPYNLLPGPPGVWVMKVPGLSSHGTVIVATNLGQYTCARDQSCDLEAQHGPHKEGGGTLVLLPEGPVYFPSLFSF